MSTITARYVDTCASDYLQDSYSRPGRHLVFSCPGLSLAETVESMHDSMDHDCGIPENISDVQICRALRDALEGVDLRYIDAHGDRHEETPEDTDDASEANIYVVLEWDATVVKMRLTVDVEYQTNGADPHDLKVVLENLISFAASDGAMQGGTEAEVVSWGATAEVVS